MWQQGKITWGSAIDGGIWNVPWCIVPDQMFTSCKPNSFISANHFQLKSILLLSRSTLGQLLSEAQNLHTGNAVSPGGIQKFFV